MRIGEANYNNYNSYIELFTKMNAENQGKNANAVSAYKQSADKSKPYVDLPYARKMSGWYAGGTLNDILTGHLKNSYGVEGMDVTNRSDYKVMVPVPDKMKALILNETKREFYEYNGMCGDDMKPLDSYHYYMNEYLKTLDVKDRLSAAYSINQTEFSLGKSVTNAIKDKVPGWIEGQQIPSGVLDDIFSDKSIVGDFADIKDLGKRIDEIV